MGRADVSIIEIPIRLEEKRPPAINLVKRVPGVMKGLVSLPGLLLRRRAVTIPTIAGSVDLDPLPCYYRIHALGEPPDELRDVVLTRALPRLVELFARHGIRATWFVVGEDSPRRRGGRFGARRGGAGAARRAGARAGDELANHSLHHPYDLARRSPAEVAAEIARAATPGCAR